MAESRQLRIRKLQFAVGLATAGIAVLVVLALVQSFPANPWLWALFAVSFVVLEWRAVEINHHLTVSPSIMVALTAGATFGPGSATLGVAAMAALAIFTRQDLEKRHWFEPMANFGQLAITVSAAITVLELIHPHEITTQNVWLLAAASMAAAAVYGFVNFNLVAFVVKRVYGREVRPWSRLTSAVVPYLGMGFIGGLLGGTYLLAGPVTLPLIAAVFFVGHLTFASYGDMREAQEATLRGFVKALEAKDMYTRGHTERVAYFSQLIGQELGYDANGLERLRWASLIHDVGKLAVPRELITKRGRLTDEEYAAMQRHVHAIDELLAEVDFLQPMVAIAGHHHTHFDGNGYDHGHGAHPGQEAYILAVADAFDAMTSTRSYRMALTQGYAFRELRQKGGSQFDPDCVEALAAALERTGEVYGSLDIDDEDEARRLATREDINVYRRYD